MDAGAHDRLVDSLRRQARYFRALALASALVSCLLAVTIAAVGLTPERVVVVPPEVRGEFWLEENRVSRGYFLEWGHYIATLLLNVTPASVEYQNEVLLRYVAAAHREAMRQELAAAAQRLQEQKLSTFFNVADVDVDVAGGRVAFTGTLASYVDGRKVAERAASYRASFKVESGGLRLLEFAEADPRDVFAAAAQ